MAIITNVINQSKTDSPQGRPHGILEESPLNPQPIRKKEKEDCASWKRGQPACHKEGAWRFENVDQRGSGVTKKRRSAQRKGGSVGLVWELNWGTPVRRIDRNAKKNRANFSRRGGGDMSFTRGKRAGYSFEISVKGCF